VIPSPLTTAANGTGVAVGGFGVCVSVGDVFVGGLITATVDEVAVDGLL